MTVFDYVYIDDKIIGGIERNIPNVAEIIRIVEKRATGKTTGSVISLSTMNQEGYENMQDTQGFGSS